jgi:hypothetical protein
MWWCGLEGFKVVHCFHTMAEDIMQSKCHLVWWVKYTDQDLEQNFVNVPFLVDFFNKSTMSTEVDKYGSSNYCGTILSKYICHNCHDTILTFMGYVKMQRAKAIQISRPCISKTSKI